MRRISLFIQYKLWEVAYAYFARPIEYRFYRLFLSSRFDRFGKAAKFYNRLSWIKMTCLRNWIGKGQALRSWDFIHAR